MFVVSLVAVTEALLTSPIIILFRYRSPLPRLCTYCGLFRWTYNSKRTSMDRPLDSRESDIRPASATNHNNPMNRTGATFMTAADRNSKYEEMYNNYNLFKYGKVLGGRH